MSPARRIDLFIGDFGLRNDSSPLLRHDVMDSLGIARQ